MTAIHLMCIISSSGLPIFTRKIGDCENLPFSTVASLNGVHMFCKSQNSLLKSANSEEWTLIWEDYDNVITLIGAAKGMTEKMLQNLIQLVYNSFLLFINADEFRSLSLNNFEQFMKREAKNFMPIIDRLLEFSDTDLLTFSDCILSSENTQILSRLNEFSNQLGSQFCCILINQKIAVGTEGWWDLDAIDQKLLTIVTSTSSQKDAPVFLPRKSPNIAYRFVTVPLTGSTLVCTICGAEPPYHDINLLVQQIWKNDMEIIQNAEKCIPRNFPNSLEVDSNILGILLINKLSHKYVISRNLQQTSSGKRTMSGSHRLDVLRTFFNQAVDQIDEILKEDSQNNIRIDDIQENICTEAAMESYWCSEYHKCHAYKDKEGNVICVLYVASVPTYTMRLITQNTLKMILQEKTVCW